MVHPHWRPLCSDTASDEVSILHATHQNYMICDPQLARCSGMRLENGFGWKQNSALGTEGTQSTMTLTVHPAWRLQLSAAHLLTVGGSAAGYRWCS